MTIRRARARVAPAPRPLGVPLGGVLPLLAIVVAVLARCAEAQAQAGMSLNVPLQLESRYVGDISVTILEDDHVAFDADRFLSLLDGIIDDALGEDLRSAADDDGRISTEAVQARNLDVRFDSRRVELRVRLRGDQRRERQISLGQRQRPDPDQLTTPEALSGYINFRAGMDYVHQSSSGVEGRGPFSANVQGAIRAFGYRGATLEGEAFFAEDRPSTAERGDLRLVYDDPDTAVRTSVGDLRYQRAGLQNAVALGGLSIERDYAALQPFRVVSPRGQRTFVLDRPSTVDVFVNDVLVRSLRLEPGRFDIRDLPFFDGLNDIRLEIRDDVGRLDTITFSEFFDANLLEPGLSQFSYNIGFPSRRRPDGGVSYDTDLPTTSLFHRYGLSDRLTIEGSFQGNAEQTLIGAGLVFATPLGSFDVGAASSWVDEVGWDYATSVDYSYGFADNRIMRDARLDLSANAFGQDFAALGDPEPSNPVVADVAARYRQLLPFELHGSLAAGYAVGREARRDERSGTVSLSRRFGPLSTLVRGDITDEKGGSTEARILLSASVLLGTDRTLRLRHDTEGGRTRAEWNKIRRNAVGSYGLTLSAERRGEAESESLGGRLTYLGNRFTANADHDMFFKGLDNGVEEQRSSLSIGTGIAFAGRRAAVGRPISDSFAIVSRHSSLSGSHVDVDPRDRGPRAHTDFLGPAVIPDLGSYRDNRLPFEVSDLPPGYDLGSESFELLPALNSGFDLRVGSDASVSVIGSIVDSDGDAVPLVGGEAHSLDDPDQDPARTFTNRAGRFAAQRLAPGRYRVRMFTTPHSVGSFEIPADSIGLVRVGEITVSPEQ